jgi:uncharacterized protein (TIGR02145 family)
MKSFQLTWMLILISSSLLFSQQKTYTIKSELTFFILVPFVEDWDKSMKKEECNYPWIEIEIKDRNSSYDWVKAVNQGKASYLIDEDTVNGVTVLIPVIPIKMDRSLGLKSLINKFYKEYNFSENDGEAPVQFKDKEGSIYELKDEYFGKMFEFKIKESLCDDYSVKEGFFELFSVKLVRDNAKNDKKVEISTLITQDNNEVKIGTQIWTTKNLEVSTFRNGEAIPEIKNRDEWEKAGNNKQPAWCYYDNEPKNGKKYGKLYNWYAVNDSRGLAPKGYHIPSDAEWTVLTDFLGGMDKAADKMKSKTGWQKNGKKSGNETNSSGFNGLPGGLFDDNGDFIFITAYGSFWSSSESNTNDAWFRYLSSNDAEVSRSNGSKDNALSVRCLKD